MRNGGREAGQRSLFDQPLGDVSVGYLDLLVTGAGVGELLAHVGVVQVLPDGRHLFGDVEASVLLGHHLEESHPKLQISVGKPSALAEQIVYSIVRPEMAIVRDFQLIKTISHSSKTITTERPFDNIINFDS